MEASKNRGGLELVSAVGEYVLIHRDAYFSAGACKKLLSVYIGSFEIARKSTITHTVVGIRLLTYTGLKRVKLAQNNLKKERKHTPSTRSKRLDRLQELLGSPSWRLRQDQYIEV